MMGIAALNPSYAFVFNGKEERVERSDTHRFNSQSHLASFTNSRSS